jgi:hypothetical protein
MWLLLPLALLMASVPARAQPQCDASRLGSLSCQVGRMCECRYERGGSLTGREEGYRWDCGILRPACPPVQLQTPTAPWPQGMPLPQLWLDRRGKPPPPGAPLP